MASLKLVDNLLSDLNMGGSSAAAESEPKKLLMIPGPTEFDSEVLSTLGAATDSHVSPAFIQCFSEALKNMRNVFSANDKSQPFILSGGGTLGWDCIVSSLLSAEKGDKALVLNTGYFSDNFKACLSAYGIEVDEIAFDIGDVANAQTLAKHLQSNPNKYRLLALTHVDTSTAVCNNVRELAAVCKQYSPQTLIAVDGVCSFAGEEFRFSKWGIDAAMTASQKALGAPPGLCILMISQRCVDILNNRDTAVHSFYANLQRWIPIMQAYEAKKGSYFSTPNVNLIKALHTASVQLLTEGMESVFSRHQRCSLAFRAAMKAIGLGLVPLRESNTAVCLSAVKYPPNVSGADFLTAVKEKNVIFAGGLHRDIKSTYFRVGHMGVSTRNGRNDILRCVEAIEHALQKVGHDFKEGSGVYAFQQVMKSAQ